MNKLAAAFSSLLALAGLASAQMLPYNPSLLLLAPNRSEAYFFQTLETGVLLHGVDLTKTLTSSSANRLTTFSQTPSFLHNGTSIPYTATLDPNTGGLSLVVTNCSREVTHTQVWQYVNDANSQGIAEGSWVQYGTFSRNIGVTAGRNGAGFLAAGFAFPGAVGGPGTNTSLYTFGGMCPYANSTMSSWTTAAEYSNSLIRLSPDRGDAKANGYDINIDEGAPIPEAGFTVTPLNPTYTVSTSGQAQKQQQDFVLLGGQTQTAFINMSQVAVFSLPQATWNFQAVTQPSNVPQIEPRSGHTAVLSEDGNSIVLFGGWVGDINTPADPQLAILDLVSGGSQWSWRVPTQSGSGLASGAGIYGHGAVMVPGGVMMVAGGINIPPSSSKRRRWTSQPDNSQFYFYNITSGLWLQSYTPPASFVEQFKQNGQNTQKTKRIGLGVGLALGAAILIALTVFYFWYSRRLKRAREAKSRGLLSTSSHESFAEPLDQPATITGGIDGRGGDAASVGRFWNVWDPSTGTYPTRAPPMQQVVAAGSSALFVNIPSPTRGLRKSVGGRNYQYHAAPRYDDKRLSRGSGYIHPIAEHDEEDEHAPGSTEAGPDRLSDAERKLREVERVLNTPDPFLEADPNPLGSHPVSPEMDFMDSAQRASVGGTRMTAFQRRLSDSQTADSPNWTVVHQAADPSLRLDTGRVSPSKTDERTSSTLSERSQVSAGSITRTMSTRTGAILAAALAARATSNSSPEQSSSSDGRTHTMSTESGRKSPYYYHAHVRPSQAKAGGVPPNSAGTDAESFTTARTNFAQLQSEGEALLGGRAAIDRDDPYQRALAAHSSTTKDRQGTATFDDYGSAALPPTRRRQGWMGSLRRALNVVSLNERSFSLTASSEQYTDDPRSSSASPTKDRRRDLSNNAPRRAVSDGGALLRHKRGRKDWADTDAANPWPRYRDDPDPGDWGEPSARSRPSAERHGEGEEEEWDVEGAASKRDVQVMFTVPKARLRVVNADMDRASLRSASDGALSRSESVRNLRREESVRTLRARSEGGMLPVTAEEEVVVGDGKEKVLREEDEELLPGLSSFHEKEKAA